RQPPDARWLHERVRAAWELRAPLREAGCTAYRWLFGEGDGLPGLRVDRSGDFAVAQTYMDGAGQLLEWLIVALNEVAPLRGIVLKRRDWGSGIGDGEERSDSPAPAPQSTERSVAWGVSPPPNLVVREHG